MTQCTAFRTNEQCLQFIKCFNISTFYTGDLVISGKGNGILYTGWWVQFQVSSMSWFFCPETAAFTSGKNTSLRKLNIPDSNMVQSLHYTWKCGSSLPTIIFISLLKGSYDCILWLVFAGFLDFVHHLVFLIEYQTTRQWTNFRKTVTLGFS